RGNSTRHSSDGLCVVRRQVVHRPRHQARGLGPGHAQRDYLRRRGTPRHWTDLLRHDLLGYDRDESILRSSAELGAPLQREDFCFRTDDVSVYWEALRHGMGIGFVAESLARSDPEVVRVLPALKLPALPVWLAVHREVRTDRRIRAVYDFLVRALPAAL
ncbi:LysR substrate-binding domain-containing protein, partial [Variovorax sp. CT11-76]